MNQTQITIYKSKLVLKQLQGGGKHIFVKCKVFGIPQLMLLDTGCSNTVFDSDSALFFDCKLSSTGEEQKNYSLNSAIDDVKIGTINNFEIGRFCTSLRKAKFISLANVNEVYKTMLNISIIGILGSDFLRKHKALIDFDKMELQLQLNISGESKII